MADTTDTAIRGYSSLDLRNTGPRYELWRILPDRTPREVFLCSLGVWEIPHLHRLTAGYAVVDKVTKGE